MDKYESQWSYVLKAIEWAAKYNIGVLMDFHAAEGSQNGWGK
jgi:glucan 1,3-beta-glucosidase